ncbi:MAG: DUF2520 domain-containing protein [Saprospiraceae bacterium]|nr:DUF2520 domain-containing protein [Saprospiraceae bacterium]
MLQKIVLLGSGNLAHHLGRYFYKNGIIISQIFSRNKMTAQALAKKLDALVDSDLDQIVRKADAYILCVNDDSIKELSTQLSEILANDKLIIHCSGSKPISEINEFFINRAVIWPIQSFGAKSKIDWNEIPFFIEATNSCKDIVEQLCRQMNWKFHPIDSERKKLIHIAAVFANNFSNFNFIIAKEILSTLNLGIEVLKPLVESSQENIFINGPEESQTGPARRSDTKVVQMHLKELSKEFPHFKELYKEYSNLIMDYYKTKK